MGKETYKQQILAGVLCPGMNFWQKVWAMTARIPRGRIVTYSQIARSLGTRAYRAVGNALNHNPYAPKVPCHRVVGSDGALRGFGGGLPLKRRLLVAEGVPVQDGKADLAHLHAFAKGARSRAGASAGPK